MAATTAQMVKELREATSAGILDCKKALDTSGGDFDRAVEILREKGLAAAAKKAEVDKACKAMEAKQKVVVAALAAASEKVKRATAAAEPKGIVDIVVSEPIVVRVQPAESK